MLKAIGAITQIVKIVLSIAGAVIYSGLSKPSTHIKNAPYARYDTKPINVQYHFL